jgi:Tol biopolymer transport system component
LSTPNDIAELLRKGIEAARNNKTSEARGYFEQVVELDDKNEKGWFWLASVVETDEERRICLSNVLTINPNNERARIALEKLQSKARERGAAVEEEVVAGVSRRQLTLVVGLGAVVVIVILIIALTVIVGNNNRQAAERATAEAVAQAATENAITLTAAADQSTASAAAFAATQTAMVTPASPTPAFTLPPTWTPTPQATVPPTREVQALPAGLSGRLAVWGGQDMLSVGYLPVGYYDFSVGGQYAQIGDALGKNISISSDGLRVFYAKYDVLLYTSLLEAINLNGTQREAISDRWQGQNILQVDSPRYGGPNRQYVVFVGKTATRQTTQVFMLDLNAPSGTNPVRQITDDDGTYSSPALSPDGTKIVVAYAQTNAANPVYDLVNIDVATGGKIPVTNDGQSYVESSPFFTKDGSQVVYSAVASNQPGNNDLYIKNANGTGSALPLYRSPADDIDPVLSPDGKYLAFASNANGHYDIYVYDQNSGTLSQLTTNGYDNYPGDWWQP